MVWPVDWPVILEISQVYCVVCILGVPIHNLRFLLGEALSFHLVNDDISRRLGLKKQSFKSGEIRHEY